MHMNICYILFSIYEGHVKDKRKDELGNEINCRIKCNQKEATIIKTVVLHTLWTIIAIYNFDTLI